MRRLMVPVLLWIALFGNIEVDGLASSSFVPADPQSMFNVLATRIESIPESSLLLLLGLGCVLISRSLRLQSSLVEIGRDELDPANVDGDATIA